MLHPTIPQDLLVEAGLPCGPPAFRNTSALGTVMPMPEATVDEDDQPQRLDHDVRGARQVLPVSLELDPVLRQPFLDDPFWAGVEKGNKAESRRDPACLGMVCIRQAAWTSITLGRNRGECIRNAASSPRAGTPAVWYQLGTSADGTARPKLRLHGGKRGKRADGHHASSTPFSVDLSACFSTSWVASSERSGG